MSNYRIMCKLNNLTRTEATQATETAKAQAETAKIIVPSDAAQIFKIYLSFVELEDNFVELRANEEELKPFAEVRKTLLEAFVTELETADNGKMSVI